MQTIRNLNILILAFLLVLTGCFGLADDAVSGDAEGQTAGDTNITQSEVNNPPFIGDSSDLVNSYTIMQTNANITYDVNTGEEIINGYSYDLYHSVVDIDGDSMTSGWDINLDGSIDYPTTGNSGFTEVYVPMNYFSQVMIFDDEINYASVAFIAVDEHGLGNAILLDVVDGESLSDRDEADNTVQYYTFSGQDAPGSDGAVIMTMDSGSDLGWASITIKASVDGAASSTIPMCDDTTTENCWASTDSNDPTAWNVGEAITVDTDCSGVCTVTINVLNNREGTTLDTTVIDVE
ncbi:MAG: hypothetical protein VXZ52_01745 [Candidatus Thermoplasmatota archaeon]|nr:hypothetical protein [Candidatus Thermoplasmatota archaeon]